MIKAWGCEQGNNEWLVFYAFESVPTSLKDSVVEIEIPGSGFGILKKGMDGIFYYEPFPEDSTPKPEPEPVPPVETSIGKRLEQIELTSAYTQLQVDYVAFLTEILTTQQK